MPIPLIIDSDISPDSWAAILFAALSPQAQLLSVSASGTGETHGPRGARNIQRLLALTNTNNVPVGHGPSTPLIGGEHFPNIMRFAIDRMLYQKLPQADKSLPILDSIEMIHDILNRSKEKVAISAVGPQTNLATLFIKYPEVKAKVKSIYIMGGAVDVSGNIQGLNARSNNTTAEWNFYCDPLAAQTVFDSGIPVFLIPLDATNQVPVTEGFKEKLSAIDNPPARFISKVLNLLTGELGQKDTFYLWDPITTVCAINPSVASFKKRKVRMVTTPGDEWGRVKETSDGTAIFVADTVDSKAFETIFLDAINQYHTE